MRLRIRDLPTDGYPTDYLIARIKGRRTTLVSDWRPLIERRLAPPSSDEEIWGALLRELAWLHAQMNRALRKTFAPLFALFEIKTIVLCLHNRAIRRTDAIDRLLARSLLADQIKPILMRGPDVRSTIAALGFEATDDLQSFENALMRAFLEDVHASGALKTFFTHFIDLRNLMLLYKHRRWNLGTPPRFISGGSIDVHAGADLDALLRRVTGSSGASVAASEGALETILLQTMTRRLLASGRTAGDTMLIVVHIWRLYTQARNQSVLHHGTRLDPGTLERELIQ